LRGSRAEGQDCLKKPPLLDQERLSGLAHEGRKPVGFPVKQEPVERAFCEAFGVPLQEYSLGDPIFARPLLELALELLETFVQPRKLGALLLEEAAQ